MSIPCFPIPSLNGFSDSLDYNSNRELLRTESLTHDDGGPV